jgi:hypothetical protein
MLKFGVLQVKEKALDIFNISLWTFIPEKVGIVFFLSKTLSF